MERKLEAKKANEKMPKWKAESMQLRMGLKNMRNDGYEPTREEKQVLQQAQNNDYVQCHICGRKFN